MDLDSDFKRAAGLAPIGDEQQKTQQPAAIAKRQGKTPKDQDVKDSPEKTVETSAESNCGQTDVTPDNIESMGDTGSEHPHSLPGKTR